MSTAQGLLEALVGSPTDAGIGAPAQAVKAVAWTRVSTDMQEERGLSLLEQLREIREYAAKREIEVVAEFSEAASAFQKEERRVEFKRMLAYVKARKEISGILVHDFSRFSRDSVRAKSLVRELRDVGVRVISLNDLEADPDTVAGVYLEAITFAKNEAYSREVAFHTRKGCRANVQARDPETGWCYKNGGQPLWGYRSQQLQRGEERRGKPIIKSVWVLDDAIVAGRPPHEWVRECLLMAAGGASLDELRDFCNSNGVPARRGRYWGISTWNSLLEPHALLQFCGHGVWNVHRKNGSIRPAAEWVIVENAHPAIITEEQALQITARRRSGQRKRFDAGYGQSRTSKYLLTGGTFKCARCGANMTGLTTASGSYYVCGSLPYRRGMGCGPGVYVPQRRVEAEVMEGAKALLGVCSDRKGFTRQVNEELRRAWEQRTGSDPQAERKIDAIDAKFQNILKAIEDGLAETAWANERLRELKAEREALAAAARVPGSPPQIDDKMALAYLLDLERVLKQGDVADRKRTVRACVQEMKLTPDNLEVEITYRLPESVMNSVVAGAGFEPATFGL
jgi:site-specific DNA recombinase